MPELVCAADSPDWLLERRKGITATDITAITGLSPYESAYSLYFKKRGDIPDEHQDNDRMRLGRELEPIIGMRWQEAHPDHHLNLVARLYRSSDRPWQLATPDREVYELPPEYGAKPIMSGVLEVKSWADYDRSSWGGPCADQGQPCDHVPARVRAQVLWQMDTLDVATGHVGVLFLPSGEFRSYVIAHEDEQTHDELGPEGCPVCMDQRLLREAGRDFMDRLDLNQPPSPDASSATLAALKARFTDIHHDKEAEIHGGLWEDYSKAKDALIHQDHWVKGLEARVREQAGEARTLTVNGTKVATRVVGDAEVKAHTRHSDYIRRATPKGETSE